MASDLDINRFIQSRLELLKLGEVTAVDAARWLDEAGLLSDSASRPGKPLRDRLRAGRISHAKQAANGRWFVIRSSTIESARSQSMSSDESSRAKRLKSPASPTPPSNTMLDAIAEASHQLSVVCEPVKGIWALPTSAGLYTLAVRKADAIADLGLEDVDPAASLVSRILYLGKAESSLADRLRDTHFKTSKGGQSTSGGRSVRCSDCLRSRAHHASPKLPASTS